MVFWNSWCWSVSLRLLFFEASEWSLGYFLILTLDNILDLWLLACFEAFYGLSSFWINFDRYLREIEIMIVILDLKPNEVLILAICLAMNIGSASMKTAFMRFNDRNFDYFWAKIILVLQDFGHWRRNRRKKCRIYDLRLQSVHGILFAVGGFLWSFGVEGLFYIKLLRIIIVQKISWFLRTILIPSTFVNTVYYFRLFISWWI